MAFTDNLRPLGNEANTTRYHEDTTRPENESERAEDCGDRHSGKVVSRTFSRIVAIASLCMYNVGPQSVLYYVSSALFELSTRLGTNFDNWMLTANALALATVVHLWATLPTSPHAIGYACSTLLSHDGLISRASTSE